MLGGPFTMWTQLEAWNTPSSFSRLFIRMIIVMFAHGPYGHLLIDKEKHASGAAAWNELFFNEKFGMVDLTLK